jgi:ribosomal protein S25
LSGVLAFRGTAQSAVETFMPRFWGALADEAAHGFDVLRLMERQWRFAREAMEARRKDSHAAKAIDLLAATPLLSAHALAERVGVSVNTATNLLESFMAEGLIAEVTRRQKRRLYGLPHLAPLRQAIAPPRHPMPGRKRGRPPKTPVETAAPPRDLLFAETLNPEARNSFDPGAKYTPLPKVEFDFSELDQVLDAAEKASAHSKEMLDQLNRSNNKLPAEDSEE